MHLIQVKPNIFVEWPKERPVNIDGPSLFKQHAEINQNCLSVVNSALHIEYMLSEAIKFYFFPLDQKRGDYFRNAIIDTDWCSFASKRKVIKMIIDTTKAVSPEEFSKVDTALRDVAAWRNRLVHGKIIFKPDKIVLSYYEGTPQEKELTDERFQAIENLLNSTEELMSSLIGCIHQYNASHRE